MKVPRVHDEPVTMTSFPHLFVIRISWTPTTWIGLVLAIFIALNAWVLAARWVTATWRLGLGIETWDLLRPVDLMAYSLAASSDLVDSLDTIRNRRMQMRGERTIVLREHERDFVRFKGVQRPGSESSGTPVREYYDKSDSPTTAATVTVRPQDADLEEVGN